MSYMKRYFEDHVNDYTDEEIVDMGFADSIEEAQELREAFT